MKNMNQKMIKATKGLVNKSIKTLQHGGQARLEPDLHISTDSTTIHYYFIYLN